MRSLRDAKIPTPIILMDFFCDRLGLNSYRARIASSVLNKKADHLTKPSDYVNLCFEIFQHIPLKYLGWPIAPSQVKQEIQTLLTILSRQDIHIMLEIGTYKGGTLFLFTRVACPNAKIISLDYPSDKPGSGYENFKVHFYTNFAQKDQRIFLIKADSHSLSSLSTVKSILKEQKIDFLFVDADHTYKGVKQDFQMYSPLVRDGGLIAFHDIRKGQLANEVSKFWDEIKHGYRHQEIISSQNKEGFGIGVLYM